MLNINIDVKIDTDKPTYPIRFEKRNVCVHCGAEHCLKFVDKFGNLTSQEIYPFDHITCTNCGTDYSILWQKDDSNGKYFPTAVEKSTVRDFLNVFSPRQQKKNRDKQL